MSRERPESKVIRKNCTTIAQTISAQGLTQWFAAELKAKDFLSSPSSFTVLGVPEFDQVVRMLQAVENRLKTTDTPKETLKEFIAILEGSPALEQLAEQINSKYVLNGGSPFNDTVSSTNGVDESSTTGTTTNAPSGGVRRRPLHSRDSEQVQQFNLLPPTPSHDYGKMMLITVAIGILFGCGGYYLWPNGKLSDNGVSSSLTPHVPTTSTKIVTSTNEPGSDLGCKVIDCATKVFRAIENDVSDWKTLGEELGINPTELDRVGRDQQGEQNRLRETIRVWQKGVPEDEFCWEKLIDALKLMKHIRLAKSISDQYNIEWKGHS